MTPNEILEIEKMYTQINQGTDGVSIIVTPYGAIDSKGKIYEFDENGVFIKLSNEAQTKHRELLKGWLTKNVIFNT